MRAIEDSLKGFPKTPQGYLFSEDVKDLFSVMILGLELTDEPINKNTISGKLKSLRDQAYYPFSFSVSDAVLKMQSLCLKVDTRHTCMTIEYNIKPHMGKQLLKVFMAGKLLHTPADRTRSSPKENILLQPTPKGVAVLHSYCYNVGLKHMPPILVSSFNSMRLFEFERSLITDVIAYNEFLLALLFGQLMGPNPNVWSPNNKPDDIPPLSDLDTGLLNGSDLFDFNVQRDDCSGEPVGTGTSLTVPRVSPFAHKYFTNPVSDSHIQHYVSNKGMRVLLDTTYGYKISTKSIWQWLMDCTDIIYPEEGISITRSFIKYGFLELCHDGSFSVSTTILCKLSKHGEGICQWTKPSQVQCTPPMNSLSINQIIEDPGLRYLFRKHLKSEFCCENLDVYLEIKAFQKKMTILANLLKHQNKFEQGRIGEGIRCASVDQTKECLSIVYRIFTTYISCGSPFELNIEGNLRNEIVSVMFFAEFNDTELVLRRLYYLFDQLSNHVLQMMAIDSLPKFLASSEVSTDIIRH